MTAPLPTDIPIRPAFWNVPLWGEIGVYIVGIAAVLLCAWGIWQNVKRWRAGKPSSLPPDPTRAKRVLDDAILQKRIRETPVGRMHAVLVAGFFLLFLGTATATLDWDIGHYVFGEQFLKGTVYLVYKLVLDAAGVAVLFCLALGASRRYLMPQSAISPLPRDKRFACAYGSLAFIIITGYLVEGLRLAVQQPAWIDFSPVGSIVAQLLLLCAGPEGLQQLHVWIWTLHGIAALAFIAAVPLTYYAHVYRTPSGIAARKAGPAGRLEKIDNIEEQETFGLTKVAELSFADRASLDACVECGRCNSVCPAVRAGTPLAPRTIIMKLRDRAAAVDRGEADDVALAGGVVTHEELFSCTTCGACARVCPAEIQTPDLIVRMRRHLALEQGEFPEGCATALENTASVGNPWGLDPYERLDWAKDLDVPVAEEGREYEVLYWVGCAASYDRRARKVARAMVKILRAAKVDFAVMAEERCHAEFARRLGEEYLYQTAAQENIENFSRYRFKRILTACPHCFNTLKNEYPDFEGGRFEVVDHASFILELLKSGRLPARLEQAGDLTVYHDPCYLARLNRITEAPRALIGAARSRTAEAAESGERTFCCGAGGGQMWTDQRLGKTPVNMIRIANLRATGARSIAVACPHCLTMLETARSSRKDGDDFAIEDIAEIIAKALPAEPAEADKPQA